MSASDEMKAELERALAAARQEQLEEESAEDFSGERHVACDWATLLDELDYQRPKWYLKNDNGDWQEIAEYKVSEILFAHGIGEAERLADADQRRVIALFKRRDEDCSRIEHDPEKRALQIERDLRDRDREDRRFAKEQRDRQQGRLL